MLKASLLVVATAGLLAGCQHGGGGGSAPSTFSSSAATDFDIDAMARYCVGEAAGAYAVRPGDISIYGRDNPPDRQVDGTFVYEGQADQGSDGKKDFRCIFDGDGDFVSLMALNSDGE